MNEEQIAQYHRDGYVLVKGFCSKEETNKLYKVAIEDEAMSKNAMDLNDQSGKKTRLFDKE